MTGWLRMVGAEACEQMTGWLRMVRTEACEQINAGYGWLGQRRVNK